MKYNKLGEYRSKDETKLPQANASVRRQKLLFGVLIFLQSICSMPVGAAVKNWTGSVSGYWSVAGNWSDGIAPASGDTLQFLNGPTRLLVTNDISNLHLTSVQFYARDYVVRGKALTITTGLGLQVSGVATVQLGVTNAGNVLIASGDAAGVLILSSNLVVSSAANTATFNTVGRINQAGVLSGNGNVIKRGAGVLSMEGTSTNTYWGSTTVNEGTLELRKSGISIPGSLYIGDDLGGSRADVVRLFTTNCLNGNVTVNSSGLLDLNGYTDGIYGLTLKGGNVTTGLGYLILGGNVTALPNYGTAYIGGRLSLNNASRLFDIGQSGDLYIDAAITSGAYPGGIIKVGNGTLILAGSNKIGGNVISSGRVRVVSAEGLGRVGTSLEGGQLEIATVSAMMGWVTNTSTASWLIGPDISAGTALVSNLVLNATANISVRTGSSLKVVGVIDGSGGISKTGGGVLELSGSSDNTYLGKTYVQEGTLQLSKAYGRKALQAPLVIGNLAGGANADVVTVQDEQIGDLVPVTINNYGRLVVNGHVETIGSLAGNGRVELSSTALFAIGKNNASTVFDGIINGAYPTIQKWGSGTLTLNGNNTYAGVTDINEGTVVVNGSQPQSSVDGFGVLAGSGAVGSLQYFKGNLTPGNEVGIITCSNLMPSWSITAHFQLKGTTPGSYDQVRVKGPIDFGDSKMTLDIVLSFASSLSNSFTLFDNDGTDRVLGQINGWPDGTTNQINGIKFVINYSGGDGNDVVITQVEARPQPILSIARVSDGNVVVSWESTFQNYVLESNTNLATSAWSVISSAPIVSGGRYLVTDSMDAPQKMYRLRSSF